MRKQITVFLLLLLVVSNISTVTATTFDASVSETTNYYEVDNGSKLRFYKDLGYDRLFKPDGSIFIDKQTYTVEYLDGDTWLKVNTPYGISKDSDKITRKDSKNYTFTDVIYHVDTGKTDVVIDSGESRIYRIVWELTGINSLNYVLDDKGVNFTGPTDWVYADWSDAQADYTYEASKTSLKVVFNVGYVAQGERYILDPVLIDSYTAANININLASNHPSGGADYSSVGQCFNTTDSLLLTSAQFRLRKTLAPTGNSVARLYAITGHYGTTAKPTGAALATSNNYDISTLPGAFAWITFTFTDAYTLAANTSYFICYENPAAGVNAANYVTAEGGGVNTDPGNIAVYAGLFGGWAALGIDLNYRVYGADGVIENIDISADPVFNKDAPSWFNVTVFDAKGVTDINTVTLQVNTTGDVNNFTLRWTQATNTFSEVSDPDGICTLNASSVRVNLNATHDMICFNYAMTGGQDGLCDVRVTTVTDESMSDTTLYVSAYTFSFFNWDDAVLDLINSAFGFFGIAGYMQQAIDFTDSISANFTNSLTGLATLINLQFQVIWATFGFFTNWATRIINRAINLGERMRDIMNGVALGTEDVWAFFEFDTWAPDVVPLAAILYWIDSIYKRGPTQGYTTVLWGDLQNMANVFAFFIGAFSMVIGFIEDKVNWVIQALP